MKQVVLTIAKEVAIAAAYEAGRLTKERFGSIDSYDEKDEHGDIVTEVDRLAERIILDKIHKVFPEHHIRSEETGDNGKQGEWMWLIDPLDGTNNFAIGMPLFGISITLLYERIPVLAVIYEPMTDRLYVAAKGEGAACNRQPISIDRAKEFHKARVGWIQGHAVQNEPTAVRLRHYIDVNTKRMMRLWAPTLQWCMLARGDLDGIIVYNSEGEDLYSGILMVMEAGGIVIDFEGNPFSGMRSQPYLIACKDIHKDYYVNLIRGGLK